MPDRTKTDICNMALNLCAIGTLIDDIDVDDTNEANACNVWYDHCLLLLLEKRAWPFAETKWTLSEVGEEDDEWSYRYGYPADCVRINRIVNPYTRQAQKKEENIAFKVVKQDDDGEYGKAILCDLEDAVMEGNELCEDETLFSASFTETLALLLAVHIATPLTVNAQIKQQLIQQYNAWEQEAATNHMTERKDDPEAESTCVQART